MWRMGAADGRVAPGQGRTQQAVRPLSCDSQPGLCAARVRSLGRGPVGLPMPQVR
jgi:hypothetical protein